MVMSVTPDPQQHAACSMQHLYTAALLCSALTRFILRLATFSLERLRCCTLIGGSRAAPCVAGKTINFQE